MANHKEKTDNIIKPARITGGEKNCFFGYYDKHQWDASGSKLLALETDLCNRPPGPDDRADILTVNTDQNFQTQKVSSTRAWCWQQGCMLQWLPGSCSSIIHNDRVADRFVSVIIDTYTGHRRMLPRPIYTVNNSGKHALSLNFSRLADTRPGYGYNGLEDFRSHEKAPADDGIFLMDTGSGDHRLILSLEQIIGTEPANVNRNAKHWVNHLLFNPGGDRFIFLHRWQEEKKRITRLCTADPDGSNIFVSSLKQGSHFIWYNDKTIFIYGCTDKHGPGYYLIEDGKDTKELIGRDVLNRDGHCSFSPDGRWMLTDEYPDEENLRTLILYDMETGTRLDIGKFYSPPELTGEARCDLHPRWDRDGQYICFDSAHEGKRDMYLAEVSKIL